MTAWKTVHIACPDQIRTLECDSLEKLGRNVGDCDRCQRRKREGDPFARQRDHANHDARQCKRGDTDDVEEIPCLGNDPLSFVFRADERSFVEFLAEGGADEEDVVAEEHGHRPSDHCEQQ